MILLLSKPPLDEAGVKRLHPTWRRIRRHELRSGAFARINREEPSLCFASTALPFLQCRRRHKTGLKAKPMYNRGKLNAHMFAAPQRDARTFSIAQLVPQSLCAEQQSRLTFFLKEEPALEMPEERDELLTCSGRNSICFTVPWGAAPITEARRQKPPTLIRAFFEPCFFHVARQPQQPVVQALKKI
jgi:hypothetical protein